MKKSLKDYLCLFILLFVFYSCQSVVKNDIKSEKPFSLNDYEKTEQIIVVAEETVNIDGFGDDGVFISDRVVCLSGYSIGQYLVTQELFSAVMGFNPSNFNRDPSSDEKQHLRPVEWVSWYGAIAFCNKLSILCNLTPYYNIEGVDFNTLTKSEIPSSYDETWEQLTINKLSDGYRLPTEAEWEFAARGADISDARWIYQYPTSSDIDCSAWYKDNSNNMTHETGLLEPNGLDLYDMCGNVWQWCFDRYGPVLVGDYTDPTGDDFNPKRVLKGGCYQDSSDVCTVNSRKSYNGYDFDQFYGFRICRSFFDFEQEE